MTLSRRLLLGAAAGAVAVPPLSRIAIAQAYPSRPLHWFIGAAAGSSPDIVARLIGQRLSERLGQPVIIEDRPGGGGNIATQAVVNAPADGYTLLFITNAHAINATLYDNLSFDFIRDIVPVASIVRVPFVMVVNPSVPAKTVPEFIGLCQSQSRQAHPGVERQRHREPCPVAGHEFGHQRNVGQRGGPLLVDRRQRPKLARFDIRQRGGQRVEHHLHMAGDQVGIRGRAAAIRHREHLHFGHHLEQFAGC